MCWCGGIVIAVLMSAVLMSAVLVIAVLMIAVLVSLCESALCTEDTEDPHVYELTLALSCAHSNTPTIRRAICKTHAAPDQPSKPKAVG
jgi:hypothetical protein